MSTCECHNGFAMNGNADGTSLDSTGKDPYRGDVYIEGTSQLPFNSAKSTDSYQANALSPSEKCHTSKGFEKDGMSGSSRDVGGL